MSFERVGRKGSAVIVCLLLLATVLATPSLAHTLEYDENGNLIEDDQFEYVYNANNRLAQVNDLNGSMVARYFYEPSGTRISKELADGTITYYPFADYEETHYPNGTIEKTSYYYANGDRIAKKVQETGKPDETYYYHPDHLGSVSAISDSSGAIKEKTKYYPYGRILSGGNDRYGFTGQERDPETSLMYYNARFYNPNTRRFTQPDTIFPDVYDPQALNRYAYVRNNPLKYIDPTGHEWWDDAWNGLCDIGNGVKDAVVGAVDWVVNHPAESIVIGVAIVATAGLGGPIIAGAAATYGAAGGLTASMVVGGVATMGTDAAVQVTGNVFNGRSWNEGITAEGLITDFAYGAAAGGLGFGAGKVASKAGSWIKSKISFNPSDVLNKFNSGNNPDAGYTVLGSGNYAQFGDDIGANYLNVDEGIYHSLKNSEWAQVNKQFLDDAIARGDTFVTQTLKDEAGKGFEWELKYLNSKGIKVTYVGN